MTIKELREQAVARRKADGVKVQKFIKNAINPNPDDYSLDEFEYFINEREFVRINGITADPIIRDNRFTNIFREFDRVSKYIFDNVDTTISDEALFQQLFMARIINRQDYLEFRITKDYLKSLDGKAFTNLRAYQLQPGIGWKYGYRTLKEAIVNGDVYDDTITIWNAIKNEPNLAKAVELGNEAFGGYIKFVLFQAILDFGYIRGHFDLASEPYTGDGAKPVLKLLETSLEELRDLMNKQDFHRECNLYDAEHALCEYRKYVLQKARLKAGKKVSRPYKPF